MISDETYKGFLCVHHGGSPICEEKNVQLGLRCPKCECEKVGPTASHSVNWVDEKNEHPHKPKTLGELLSTEEGRQKFAEALVIDQLDGQQQELLQEATEKFVKVIENLVKNNRVDKSLEANGPLCEGDRIPGLEEEMGALLREYPVPPADQVDENLEKDVCFDQLSIEQQQARLLAVRKHLKFCIPTSWWDKFKYDINLPISFEEYQAGAKKTAIYNQDARVLYPALGLAGEVGEVGEKVLQMAVHAGKCANQVKKIIRDDDCECDTPRKHAIGKEIGGVLWYCAAVASDLGLSLANIAQENLDILAFRRDRGTIQGDGDNR